MSVAIANSTILAQAFRYLELSNVSSFADNTPQAQAAASEYPVTLRSCLEAADWGFASALIELPEATGLPADPDLPHNYVLPSDCLALRQVMPDGVAYRQDHDALRTDEPGPLTIRYTQLQEDEDRFPATFQRFVSLTLAVALAPKYVEVRAKREALAYELDQAKQRAERTDARTSSPRSWSGSAGSDWASEATR